MQNVNHEIWGFTARLKNLQGSLVDKAKLENVVWQVYGSVVVWIMPEVLVTDSV